MSLCGRFSTDPSFPQDLAVHNTTGKMYWTAPFVGTIRRANLNGSRRLQTPEGRLTGKMLLTK